MRFMHLVLPLRPALLLCLVQAMEERVSDAEMQLHLAKLQSDEQQQDVEDVSVEWPDDASGMQQVAPS